MLFEYYAFLTFEYLVKSWFGCYSSFRIILILTAQNNEGGWKPRWRQYEYSRCSVEWIELLFFSFKSIRVNHYMNLWKLVIKNKSPWIQTFCFFFLGFFLSLQDICYIKISNSIFYDLILSPRAKPRLKSIPKDVRTRRNKDNKTIKDLATRILIFSCSWITCMESHTTIHIC